ncbi:MAG: hypothetical protein M0Z75_13690 [Nitrospiraceae bacterium]|nr:hypothetical protein [Nitrospiraceae bacterium]
MKIGIYDIDGRFPNLALMKISAWHRKQGHAVDPYIPLLRGHYDQVYASKIFTFSDGSMVTNDMICGGTGFDLTTVLPAEIEAVSTPDYSLYPSCNYSIQYFSRGCIRRCPFCVVGDKEGSIRAVEPMDLNPRGKWIEVLDNNFFANPEWRSAVQLIKKWNLPVNFHGLDIRIMTDEQMSVLKTIRRGGGVWSTFVPESERGKLVKKQLKIAWDNPKDTILPAIQRLLKHISKRNIMVYVLIGYWSTPEEDLYRVTMLDELGVDPYVMAYDKSDEYQNNFARWVNQRAIFKSCEFKDYQKGVKKAS